MSDILIVEDELIAAEYLKEVLLKNGFNVVGIIDKGKEAMEKIPEINPDMVLMDIMLKDSISGSEVALYLKQHAPKVAIIFLTAYADNEMVEYAIESNSYGYLMKPYNEKEIVNTLKVITSRIKECYEKQEDSKEELLQINSELSFNRSLNRLFKNNKELKLGTRALKFIELLCRQPDVTVSNEQISLEVWGEEKNSITLRTQVYRIRVQIGDNIIHNVNGLGYMLKTK